MGEPPGCFFDVEGRDGFDCCFGSSSWKRAGGDAAHFLYSYTRAYVRAGLGWDGMGVVGILLWDGERVSCLKLSSWTQVSLTSSLQEFKCKTTRKYMAIIAVFHSLHNRLQCLSLLLSRFVVSL